MIAAAIAALIGRLRRTRPPSGGLPSVCLAAGHRGFQSPRSPSDPSLLEVIEREHGWFNGRSVCDHPAGELREFLTTRAAGR
jgi:hypothetical protein